MRIKKFVGATLQDATLRMKDELGSDAIILNTRKVPRGGLMNFLGKEAFEITAAVDDDARSAVDAYVPAMESRRPVPATRAAAYAMNATGATAARESALEGLAQVAREFEKRTQGHAIAPAGRPEARELGDMHLLKGEVQEIRATLAEIAGHMKYANMPSLPDALKKAYVTLLEQDVEEQLAADLVQSAYIRLGEDGIGNPASVERHVLGSLATLFTPRPPARGDRKKMKVVVLLGPTGVGKTTTIAKLAAQSKLSEGRSVGLISADTYRIGAIEQLHTFASIADIPMEVVYKPAEMERTLRKFRGRDIVYVDTVGRSHYKKKEVAEVAKFVEAAGADEVYLVMSASTQARTLMDSAERFKVTRPKGFIITKTDEAASFGSLLSLVKRYTLPVSFVTTGQGVPDDIVAARPEDLAMMVYKGVLPHA
jgi:flagellar biosynthesis protein FlhF